jgi:hypothetical protein
VAARQSVGEHEIANRLRLTANNLTKGLVEQFVAEFPRDITKRLLGVLRLKPHFYNLFAAMLKMDKTAVGEPIDDFHQRRLVVNPEVNLREERLVFRL